LQSSPTEQQPLSVKPLNEDKKINYTSQETEKQQSSSLKSYTDKKALDTKLLFSPTNNQSPALTAPNISPALNRDLKITPTQIDVTEKIKDVNIPDNSDILTNIASNTETTNDTLKNLNGAILKLAQVFNNKLDKPSGNNIVINGDKQQASYPSASQVAASNFDPISQVRQQFGLV
jgi:hypothetical protein